MIRLAFGGEFQVETQLLDEHLFWNMRIGELISKTSEKLGMLRRMRGNLTVYSANAMYISFICLIMEYNCDTVWNCCRVCNSSLSEKLIQ